LRLPVIGRNRNAGRSSQNSYERKPSRM